MYRNYQIDTLRSIACILVIAIHIVAPNIDQHNANNVNFILNFTIDTVSRVSVPLFVMISGRFLLFKDFDYKYFYSNRLRKILIPTSFWILFYISIYIVFKIIKNETIDIELIIRNFVAGKPYYHLWYMYMLVGLYMIIPVLNNSLKGFTTKSLTRVGVIFLAIGMINQAYNFVFDVKPFFILWCLDYIGYFILGYSLKDQKYISNLRLFILFLIICAGNSIVSIIIFTEFNKLPFFNYTSAFVIAGTLAIYSLFSNLKIRENILSKLSKLSFGVYLIHPLVIESLDLLIKKKFFMKELLMIGVVYVISNLVVSILIKNKLFSKII